MFCQRVRQQTSTFRNCSSRGCRSVLTEIPSADAANWVRATAWDVLGVSWKTLSNSESSHAWCWSQMVFHSSREHYPSQMRKFYLNYILMPSLTCYRFSKVANSMVPYFSRHLYYYFSLLSPVFNFPSSSPLGTPPTQSDHVHLFLSLLLPNYVNGLLLLSWFLQLL